MKAPSQLSLFNNSAPVDFWESMPEFVQKKKQPFKKAKIITEDGHVFVRFKNIEDYDRFLSNGAKVINGFFYFKTRRELEEVAEQTITKKTKSIWFPYKSHWGGIKYKYDLGYNLGLKYPVYIVSKGRWSNCITSRALFEMGVHHFIVVEKQEVNEYKKNKNELSKLLVLPTKYLDNYETCDTLNSSKSKGPGAARNFCIDHSAMNGSLKHWVMDDNIDAFHYLNRNEKYEVKCDYTLRAAEVFFDRFLNAPVCGLNYYSFCKKEDKVPPFKLNTRIYSCLFIDNKAGYRWRGRYNEDTDLSLRVLKDGKCTIQLNAFLCGKITTQRMRGGNSKEFYDNEGTAPKSEMLVDLHPDVAKIAWKFNRCHHHVDYTPFAGNVPLYKIENKPSSIKGLKMHKVMSK